MLFNGFSAESGISLVAYSVSAYSIHFIIRTFIRFDGVAHFPNEENVSFPDVSESVRMFLGEFNSIY